MVKGKTQKKSANQSFEIQLVSQRELSRQYVDYTNGGTAAKRNQEEAEEEQKTVAQVADSFIHSKETDYTQGIAWEHQSSEPITTYKPKANPTEKKRRKAREIALTTPVYAPTPSSSTAGFAPVQSSTTVVPANDLLHHQPTAYRSHPVPSSTVFNFPIPNGPANGLPMATAAPIPVPAVGLRQQSTATLSAKKRARQDDPINKEPTDTRPFKGARYHTPDSTPASSQVAAYALTGTLTIHVDANGLKLLSSPNATFGKVVVNDSAHTWLKYEGELLSGSFMLDHVAEMSTQPLASPTDYLVMYQGTNGPQPMLLRNVSSHVGVKIGKRTHSVNADVATLEETGKAVADCQRKVEAIKKICGQTRIQSAGPPTGTLPTMVSSVSQVAIGYGVPLHETQLPSPSVTTAASPADEGVIPTDDFTYAPSGTRPSPLQVVSPTPSLDSERGATQTPSESDIATHLPEADSLAAHAETLLYGLRNLTSDGVKEVLRKFAEFMEEYNKSAARHGEFRYGLNLTLEGEQEVLRKFMEFMEAYNKLTGVY
ncbi:hypothetical protein CYLTODRAFT_491768 [Cylindrobasidium torrendii FP15055 ss-10]|uniref:Uncharacterized protein n=1 Tax=Cylindrobasidium torrendii FP15055 ss-10 TaxID=1314674 RepID=A0A0D7B7C1_9AGAR|nr:hypothetical protein CYLTODRAFT_491768 [Cylindrobasidium torrendii FP15055 ss-10]